MALLTVITATAFVTSYFATQNLLIPNIFAATSPWTQTDWSGGTASGTVTGTVTTYESGSNIMAGTAGQVSLEITSGWSSDYSSWGYRRKITFDNTTSNLGVTSEALTDFPVLVKLDSGTDIDYAKTKDAGEDIRFTDSDGTVLSYELEQWDESGSSYVWVKVPQIDSDSDTDYIYMYYGNTNASDSSSGSGVFDSSDYSMVYHFNESGGSSSVSDSSGNTSGTVASGTSLDQSGKISTAVDFSSSNGGISLGSLNSPLLTADTTISFWIYTNNYASPSRQNPFGQAYGGWGTMTIETNGRISWFFGSSGRNASPYTSNQSNNLMANGQWIYVTAVRDNTSKTYSWYKNGAYLSGSGYSASYPVIQNQTFNIGDDYVNHINGKIDEFRVYKSNRSAAWIAASYKSETDDFNTFTSEENKLSSSATLTSNIFNAEFAADWGSLTYTTSGTGTVTVKVRSDSSSDMSGATAWGSCSGIATSTDLTGTDCVTDTDQYLQYQVTLEPSGASTPVFEDISIGFAASDQVAPPTNASSVAVTGIADTNAWTNDEVTVTWTAGADDSAGNGLAGYCVALDEVTITGSESSNSLNPATTAGSLLNALDDGISNNSSCGYIVAGTSIDLSAISGLVLTTGRRYYFSIKAVDLAGNVYTGASNTFQDLVDFKYDDTAPTNVSYISAPSNVFGNVDDMSFSWPISGGSSSSDDNSGLHGWQYSLDSGSTWRGPDTDATLSITYIDDDGSTSSHDLTDATDGSDISEGINTVYVRTVDEAGNFSSASTYRTAPLNFGGDAPAFSIACDLPTGITVTPETSTSNSFALSWDGATATGGNSLEGYYYMINTSPPSTLSTLQSNSTQYIANSTTSVVAKTLTGSVKGTNTVYVVTYDDDDNYSQSNCLKGEYTLNSTLPDPVTNLSATDASIKSDELWRASVTWTAPTYQGTGTLTYIVEKSTDNSTWTEVTTTTGTAYTDTVATSNTYYYRVGVYDTTSESISAPTYSTSVSVLPKGTWDVAPSISGDPTITGITTKKATINWSTSRTADSKIQYGTSSGSYFDEESSKSEQVTSHTIQLTNLSPGTKYYYKVKWTDEDGNTSTSSEFNFTTDPAPSVIEPSAINVGLDSAIIAYTVSGATKVKIYYGETTTFGGVTKVSTSTAESEYTTQLTGLNDGTKYYYKINTLDSEGDEYEGNTLTFTTLPRPRISKVRIQQIKGTAQPTVLVSWTTNTSVSSILTYFPTSSPADARDEINVALTEGEHRMIIRGLLPNTSYTMIVKGRDIAGNQASSTNQRFTTATDTRPPAIIDLKVEGTINKTRAGEQTAQLIVSWNTDEPATSQVEFGEGTGSTYAQKTQQDSNETYNHVVIISNLTPSKVYHLRAISTDEGGNVGESIDTVTITPKATDNALDLVISNLSEVFGFLR